MGDLTLIRTPAIVATRFSSRTAGNGAATGLTRSGDVFPEVGQEETVRISNVCQGKMTKEQAFARSGSVSLLEGQEKELELDDT